MLYEECILNYVNNNVATVRIKIVIQQKIVTCSSLLVDDMKMRAVFYYRKRGSASYIVREVHLVREIQRERERDGSDVTIVLLKLAMSFALLLAKNVHLSIGDEFCAFPFQKICTSVSPLLNGAEFTLSVAKNVALFETHSSHCQMAWIDRGSKQQSKRSNFRLHHSSFLPKKIEKMNQINTKNYWK